MEAEITYQLEVSDLFATHRYSYKTNKANNLTKLFAYTLFTITIIQTLMKIEEALWLEIVVGILTLGICIVGFNLFMYFVSLLFFRVNLPKDGTSGILCEHTIQITPTQLIERTSVNETRHRWISVKRLQELPNHLLIILNNNQAYTIPKKAFESTSNYQNFYEMARQFLQQVREAD
ncbi:YcxB family protein [Neosynechococcus sphagnicola]|nr:YcxB family protein [Neosynechococcus sphagnicola]